MLKAQCPTLKITGFDPPEIVQQPQIAKGVGGGWQVTDGAWVQRATLDRCGKPAARRMMVENGANNTLRLHALLPGDYGGGYRLESNALGYVVVPIRYAAVAFGGALAGLAGAYMSLAYTPLWAQDMTAGRGWVAVALVTFSAWRPFWLLIGAWFFGALMYLSLYVQALGVAVPSALLSALSIRYSSAH